jgi:hypothetical protein
MSEYDRAGSPGCFPNIKNSSMTMVSIAGKHAQAGPVI